MKLARNANLGVLVLAFTLAGALSLVFTPAFVRPVEAQTTATGLYIGHGNTQCIQLLTGLVANRSLRIVTVPERGRASVAYATNTFGYLGVFLNGDKKDTGITLDFGSFTVCNLDFNENGVVYYWEVNGA